MTFHAIDDIDDAFAATKEFLLPFDLGRWLRLTVIAFFVGGAGMNAPSGNVTVGDGIDGGAPPGGMPVGPPEITDALLAALAAVAALVVLLGLVWAILSAIMEFVLVESLREEEVHVRRYGRRYLGKGLRLFGFRLVLGLVALAVVGIPLAAAVLAMGGLGAIDSLGDVAALFALGVLLAFPVGIGYAVVGGFTTVFVVPVMILEDRAVLPAWRRFWATLRAEWKQYLVYLGMAFVLHLVAGIAVGAVVGLVGAILFVPVFVGGGIALLAGGLSPFALVAVAAVGVVGLLAFLLVAAVVQVPVVTFLRYYALLVLGDTDADLDLVPERRAAIREST